MDLKSKLSLYNKKGKSESQPTDSGKPVVSPEKFDPASIGCSFISTENGDICRTEKRYSKEEIASMYGFEECGLHALLRLNSLDMSITLDDIIFFDLETTSLSIGTGNYPFLIGLGYADGDDFIVEQIFLDEYSREPGILAYLIQFFEKAKAVVVFNGASFDMPLIKNRYMINRVWGFPVKIPVIDLIVPARRIFKSVYESCSLQSLEKNLLGFDRGEDIPGWMIPSVYFDFQRTGDSSQIASVILHNRYDITSMLALLHSLAAVFSSVAQSNFSTLTKKSLFNMARHLFNADMALFIDLAEFIGEDISEDQSVFEKYSIAMKRIDEWEKAAAYWEKSDSYFSSIELAKYHEHRMKDPAKALASAQRAKIQIRNNKDLSKKKTETLSESIDKRIERLKNKLNKI